MKRAILFLSLITLMNPAAHALSKPSDPATACARAKEELKVWLNTSKLTLSALSIQELTHPQEVEAENRKKEWGSNWKGFRSNVKTQCQNQSSMKSKMALNRN